MVLIMAEKEPEAMAPIELGERECSLSVLSKLFYAFGLQSGSAR